MPRWKLNLTRLLAVLGVAFWGALTVVGVAANDIWPPALNAVLTASCMYVLWALRSAER